MPDVDPGVRMVIDKKLYFTFEVTTFPKTKFEICRQPQLKGGAEGRYSKSQWAL